jgi:CheY-like chemotaxis protein
LDKIIEDIRENEAKGFGLRSSYKLILIDCSMPMMDGYETTEIIRSLFHLNDLEQPIISALTGHTDQQFID